MIIKHVGNIDWRDISGSLDQVTNIFKVWHGKRINEGWSDVTFEPDNGYDSSDIGVYCKRLETDKEFDVRMIKEKAVAANLKVKEIAARGRRKEQYEELKKEFGN